MQRTAIELEVGDEVLQHGGIFRVTSIVKTTLDGEAIHANISKFVCLAPGEERCSIPEHWRADWNIQGNHRHRVWVVSRGCQ